MKKYLLPNNGAFYKANLHCHSTVSDGRLTVEEIKELYTRHGYSVVAFTDHDVLIPHPELRDEHFLPLNGYEVEINDPDSAKTCHICFVALKPDNLTQVCYHRTKYLFANAVNYRDKVRFDDTLPDFERAYTPERISEMMKIARDSGFFVTYNHPTWSLESYPEYTGYHHMHAMEIYNHSCAVGGFSDYNPRVYDDMLRSGEKIYCIAADDNHNRQDACGGFTMIKAPELDYEAITTALVNGDFYASNGPEIHELYFEDGEIRITCSDADRIVLTTGRRKCGCRKAENGSLNQAGFRVDREDLYVRITVIDEKGRTADTNAYFTDALLDSAE